MSQRSRSKSPASKGPRRTTNARSRGRAAKVVERVFEATAEELGRVGYGAMRIEDVAARSRVHKTTIYRRWLTKAELVAATITAMLVARGGDRGSIDTGTVRGDLRASVVTILDLDPVEQGILRVMQLERTIPEVNALAHRFSEALRAMRLSMVERGIARGELPGNADAELIVDLLTAVVQRALLLDEKLDPRYIDRVLDLVLAGAAASATSRSAAGTPYPAKSVRRRRRTRAGNRDRAKAG